MSGPTQFMAPKTDEYAGDEVSALVLDPGYATTRAGFAGEDVPKSVIPTCYGVIESPNTRPHYLLGENLIHNPTPGLEIRNPISSEGIVEDWDMAARVWEYSITERLTGRKPTNAAQNGLNDPANGDMDVDMEGMDDVEKPLADSPLLMSEPAWNTTKAREKCIEIAMEDWGAPAFYLARTGVLAAFSAGKATALVIDIGASTTSVTPVSDGMILRKSIAKSPLAGNFVSQQIRLMFSQSQPVVPLIPHYMVASKSPVDAGAPSQATFKQFKVPMTASFQRLEEERVLTEFKESVVQVYEAGRLSGGSGSSVTNEDMMRNHPGRPFEMPDGWNQVFGVERFKVVEGLFDAKAALSDAQNPPPREEHTLPKTIAAALNTIQEPDLKAQLLNHVVVVGGSSLLVGLTRRLSHELEQAFPGPRIRVFAPGNTVERKYASWIGGSILASLGSFHQMWVSKKEYNEHGPNIIEKRCK